MLHKKSPDPFGIETPIQNHYTRKPYPVKTINRRLPPYGKFYSDILQGKTIWNDELFCLIYIGSDEAFQIAQTAREVGLPHPIILPPNVNPEIYHWTVSGLDVRILEWEDLSPVSESKLVFELIKAEAKSIYINNWVGMMPLTNRNRGVRYE